MLLGSMGCFAQNELLAKNYFDQGEYEKASLVYEKLYKENSYNLNLLSGLVESYQQLEEFDKAEALLKEKLNSSRPAPQLYVALGNLYALQNREVEKEQAFNKAIAAVDENPAYSFAIGNAFEELSLLDEAIVTYEKAMVLDPKKDFSYQLARIYGEQGKLKEMFEKYLDLMQSNVAYKSTAQRNFSIYISEDPTNEANAILRRLLLQKLQDNPDILYNKLLSWLFIQQKEYKKAFTQEKAIYKRGQEELNGIAELALIAINDEAYEDSKEIIAFLIENSYAPEAKLQGEQYLMKIALKTAKPEDYENIEQRFNDLLDTYGKNQETYLLQIDYNHFLAFEIKKPEVAIANLKLLLKESLTDFQEARVKMELSDILVFQEKFNEALIFYSQIQNKVKSDVLAQEARFKVARTSYFKGDFKWAQIQLDVLKKSASQLIANDAMQLSLLIRDNSLEDSTQTAIKKYARADLLALQNKDIDAIAILEDILTNHKGESIEDEAILKEGELFEKLKQYNKAEAAYLKLIDFFKDDILADDAYYRLARLYENEMNKPEKAKQYYEQILFNFADSIYFVEARKKFRVLRGDSIN